MKNIDIKFLKKYIFSIYRFIKINFIYKFIFNIKKMWLKILNKLKNENSTINKIVYFFMNLFFLIEFFLLIYLLCEFLFFGNIKSKLYIIIFFFIILLIIIVLIQFKDFNSLFKLYSLNLIYKIFLDYIYKLRHLLIIISAGLTLYLFLWLTNKNEKFTFIRFINFKKIISNNIINCNSINDLLPIFSLCSIFVLFVLWIIRDYNKKQEIENHKREINLKDFHQITQWAIGTHFENLNSIFLNKQDLHYLNLLDSNNLLKLTAFTQFEKYIDKNLGIYFYEPTIIIINNIIQNISKNQLDKLNKFLSDDKHLNNEEIKKLLIENRDNYILGCEQILKKYYKNLIYDNDKFNELPNKIFCCSNFTNIACNILFRNSRLYFCDISNRNDKYIKTFELIFKDAEIKYCLMNYSIFNEFVIQNSKFELTYFNESNINFSKFNKSTFVDINFNKTKFKIIKFNTMKLINCLFDETFFKLIDYIKCNIDKCTFDYSTIDDCILKDTKIENTTFISTIKINLLKIINSELTNIDISYNTCIEKLLISNSILNNINFITNSLKDSAFYDIKINLNLNNNTGFSYSDFSNNYFNTFEILNSKIKLVNFTECRFLDTKIIDTTLENISFEDSKLIDTIFYNVNFVNINFAGVRFENVKLYNIDLESIENLSKISLFKSVEIAVFVNRFEPSKIASYEEYKLGLANKDEKKTDELKKALINFGLDENNLI